MKDKVMQMVTMVIMILVGLIPNFKKSDSKVGIKEFLELLKAINVIAILLIKRFKDGVGVDDFTAFYAKLTTDDEFKQTIKDGYDGYNKIPAELKDIDTGEILEVVKVQVEYVPGYFEAIEKEEDK